MKMIRKLWERLMHDPEKFRQEIQILTFHLTNARYTNDHAWRHLERLSLQIAGGRGGNSHQRRIARRLAARYKLAAV